ncbi:MAG: VWA domain-containing protein [Nitrospirota bacterium]
MKSSNVSFFAQLLMCAMCAAWAISFSSCAKKADVTGSGRSVDRGIKAEFAEGMAAPSSPGLPETLKKETYVERKAAEGMPAKARSESGLRAGYADDNKQFNYFVGFLRKYESLVQHHPININERIILNVQDRDGKPVPNADVAISANGKPLSSGRTYSDGSFLFFPSEYPESIHRFKAVVTSLQKKKEVAIDRQGNRDVEIKLELPRSMPAPIPLDILFILDTTGSMGEEIARLRQTIELINLNLTSLTSRPHVRFGMVLYRDRGDKYVTETTPLTDNLDEFRKKLNTVTADGGGDGPEDLQSALKEAVRNIDWSNKGIRLAFVITDAPPHLYYDQKYTYADAAADAKQQGLKIFTVGTGGLDLMGEYILRQISQYTYGRYIFLTYGEKGESEGGREGSVSHHTGSNFQTDKLESIIIRFAKQELSNVTSGAAEEDEDYFTADKRDDEARDVTLQKLFDMAISQLVDYSSIAIPQSTTTAVFPLSGKDESLSVSAEYFGEQLGLSLSRNKTFKMVERKDLQAILEEMKLHMTGLVSEQDAAKTGKMLGAKMVVTGNLYRDNKKYELFLKLIRVESAEVLSVTKTLINKDLGLTQ